MMKTRRIPFVLMFYYWNTIMSHLHWCCDSTIFVTYVKLCLLIFGQYQSALNYKHIISSWKGPYEASVSWENVPAKRLPVWCGCQHPKCIDEVDKAHQNKSNTPRWTQSKTIIRTNIPVLLWTLYRSKEHYRCPTTHQIKKIYLWNNKTWQQQHIAYE